MVELVPILILYAPIYIFSRRESLDQNQMVTLITARFIFPFFTESTTVLRRMSSLITRVSKIQRVLSLNVPSIDCLISDGFFEAPFRDC